MIDEEGPPPAFGAIRDELAKTGIELAWVWRYNAGSNPIGLTITMADLERPEVRALLEETWRALS